MKVVISGARMFEQMAAKLTGLGGGLKYAAVSALSVSAKQVATQDYPAAARSIFRDPGPFVRNSLYVKPPQLATLSIELGIKDAYFRFTDGKGKSGNAPADILAPQITGGGRPMKRGERRLAPFYPEGGGWYIPGKGGLTPAGKLAPGIMADIMAGLKISEYGNRSPRSRKGRAPNRGEFVVLRTRNGKGLAVYRRVKGSPVLGAPVLVFMAHPPQYRARFPVGDIVRDNFSRQFPAALDAAAGRMRAKFGGTK